MLNESLYQALMKRFGEVKVANEGEEREVLKIGPDQYEASNAGEQYRVCCPYCGDTRFRLYISYKWNTVDPENVPNKHLAHCFNEECDLECLRDELQSYLLEAPVIGRDPSARYRPAPLLFEEVPFPGLTVSIRDLSKGHECILYLKDRGFDPEEIAHFYNVHFCVEAEGDENGHIPGTKWSASCCKNRLIIPVYRMGKLIGWQARALNNFSKPKYYTMPGMKKNFVIYNGDLCRHYDFGVIVEGVTDVWKVGPCAGAIFGHSISTHQLNLIYAFWQQKGGMCLLLDPDVMRNTLMVDRLIDWKSFMLGAFPLCLVGAEDPGAMDRRELWDTIASAARARGVRLVRV